MSKGEKYYNSLPFLGLQGLFYSELYLYKNDTLISLYASGDKNESL
jgi:hypothetical protein